jgi:AP endonuclease-1
MSSAISRLAKALTKALSETSTVTPVLETMCGHGTTIGGSLSDFGSLMPLIPPEYHSRIGVCIDTCHSFAAGYDLVSPAGFKTFMDEFEEVVGLKFLRALHLNDSKAPRGSKRDLHANIGTGFLGLRAFHNIMNEKRFEGLPMILETPIDRPDPSWVPSDGPANGGKEGLLGEEEDETSCAEPESSDSEASPEKGKKKQKKTKQKAAKRAPGGGPKMIPDHSVWVREIKLLESLIGMDPESAEFRALEAQLAEEGRAEREKYQDQYERKLEAEEKKRKKEEEKLKGEKVQRSIVDMMKG